MKFKDVAGLYGQNVFFFLLGVMLFGYAFQKHGLGNRFALSFLSIPGVATTGRRVVLVIMAVTAVVSAIIDDAAAIAIILPMAIAVVKHIGETQGLESTRMKKFYAATALGVMWGSASGGLVTPAGVPYTPLIISTLEEVTKYSVSFSQWASVGLVTGIATLLAYFAVVILMFDPEVKKIPDATAYFTVEKSKLGPLSMAEKNVLAVLVVMIILWFLPGFMKMPKWLDIWIVPVIGMILLFLLPAGQGKNNRTLVAKDFQEGIAWNVIFLALCGAAIASGLAKVGLIEWIQKSIPSDLSPAILPWMTAILTSVISHVSSGTSTTALMSSILFPVSESLNYNPVILGRIIAGTAFAMSFPWAGASAATTFSFGAVSFKDMVKGGVVVSIVTIIVVTITSIVFVPLFGGFTGP